MTPKQRHDEKRRARVLRERAQLRREAGVPQRRANLTTEELSQVAQVAQMVIRGVGSTTAARMMDMDVGTMEAVYRRLRVFRRVK